MMQIEIKEAVRRCIEESGISISPDEKDNGFIWQKDIRTQNPMDAVYGGMLWLFEQGLVKKGDDDE